MSELAENVIPFAPPRPASKPQPDSEPGRGSGSEPLLREVIGDVLRAERREQRRTLREVADDAGVSLPYLSEIERGSKEASSEFVAAIGQALGLRLSEITIRVAGRLSSYDATNSVTTPTFDQPGSASMMWTAYSMVWRPRSTSIRSTLALAA